jgi:hypothetical protein
MQRKSLIFVVISAILAALVYNSSSTSNVFVQGKPVYGAYIDCDLGEIYGTITCCWEEQFPEYQTRVCQTCHEDGTNCGPIVKTSEEPPKPPRSVPLPPTVGENMLQRDLGVLEQTPSQGLPPLKQGQGVLPQDGVLEQAPADQGAAEAPRTVEPPAKEGAAQSPPESLTDCPEGQILDEETGLCVLEEPGVAEEEPEPAEEQEEQPTEEGADSSEDNSNN